MMKRLVLLCSWATFCADAQFAEAQPTAGPGSQAGFADEWSAMLSQQRELGSRTSFLDSTLAGAAAFTIGTYGIFFERQGLVTSAVYSVLQTSGIYLATEGYRDRYTLYPSVVFDRHFDVHQSLDRQQLQRIWIRTLRNNRRVDLTADTMLWGGLSVTYLVSGFRESTTSTTMRSLYFFLAANGALLAAVSGFKLYLHGSSTPSVTSLTLEPSPDGAALTWTSRW
jgi:hypothetical protein